MNDKNLKESIAELSKIFEFAENVAKSIDGMYDHKSIRRKCFEESKKITYYKYRDIVSIVNGEIDKIIEDRYHFDVVINEETFTNDNMVFSCNNEECWDEHRVLDADEFNQEHVCVQCGSKLVLRYWEDPRNYI